MNALYLMGAGLAYAGMAAHSYAMERHYAAVHGRAAAPGFLTRRLYRTGGWMGILASFAACVRADGWHIGPVLWCGQLSASAMVLALLLHYAPRGAFMLGWLGLLAVAAAGTLHWLPA